MHGKANYVFEQPLHRQWHPAGSDTNKKYLFLQTFDAWQFGHRDIPQHLIQVQFGPFLYDPELDVGGEVVFAHRHEQDVRHALHAGGKLLREQYKDAHQLTVFGGGKFREDNITFQGEPV